MLFSWFVDVKLRLNSIGKSKGQELVLIGEWLLHDTWLFSSAAFGAKNLDDANEG